MTNFVEIGGEVINLDMVSWIEPSPTNSEHTWLFFLSEDDSRTIPVSYPDFIGFVRALSVSVPNFERWLRTRPAVAAERVAEAREAAR